MIPNPPQFCTLSGLVEDAAGTAMGNRIVRVRILDGVGAVVGNIALSSAPITVYTDEDGAFEVVLPRGALARIEIPESGLDASFSVPNTAEATLANLQLQAYDP